MSRFLCFILSHPVINDSVWFSEAYHKPFCTGAKTTNNTSITVGEKIVELAELSCSTPLTKRQTSTTAFGDVCECIIWLLYDLLLSNHLACIGDIECLIGGDPSPAIEDCQTIFDGIMSISALCKSTYLSDRIEFTSSELPLALPLQSHPWYNVLFIDGWTVDSLPPILIIVVQRQLLKFQVTELNR